LDKIERYRAYAARALADAETCPREDAKVLRKLARAWLDLAEFQSEEPDPEPQRSVQTDRPHSERN
jgi:hypothetical protein